MIRNYLVVFLVLFGLLQTQTVFGEGKDSTKTCCTDFICKRKNKMLSNGIYFNVAFGYPRAIVTPLDYPELKVDETAGVHHSWDIGGQLYLLRNKKKTLGVGLNMLFYTRGYASYSPPDEPGTSYKVKGYGFCGLGPIFTYSPIKYTAIDFYVIALPSQQHLEYISPPSKITADGFGGILVPGVKVRFMALTVGFEFQYSVLTTPVTIPIPIIGGSVYANSKNELRMPRLTVGIKI